MDATFLAENVGIEPTHEVIRGYRVATGHLTSQSILRRSLSRDSNPGLVVGSHSRYLYATQAYPRFDNAGGGTAKGGPKTLPHSASSGFGNRTRLHLVMSQ